MPDPHLVMNDSAADNDEDDTYDDATMPMQLYILLKCMMLAYAR